MALKVNVEGGVTIGEKHYPLGTRAKIERIKSKPAKGEAEDEGYEPAIAGNADEIDELVEKGYLIDTEADDDPEPTPKAKKGKGGK